MKYKIPDIDATFDGQIVKNLGNSEYVIKIDDSEQNLRILHMDARGIEFILNQQYHRVKYLDASTAEMNMSVDGVPITVNMHPDMDEVVYKNSGGSSTGGTLTALKSQIPGKVISIAVQEGASVQKGDVICTLESMKMQVGIKSHKDGTVKSVKVKEGNSVAKNDLIAEIE